MQCLNVAFHTTLTTRIWSGDATMRWGFLFFVLTFEIETQYSRLYPKNPTVAFTTFKRGSGINIINISLKVQKAWEISFHPFPMKWIEPVLDFGCILASMHHFWSSIINRKGSFTKTNKTLTKFPQVIFSVPFLINFSQKVDGMPLSSSSRWVTRSVTKEIYWWYWLHT